MEVTTAALFSVDTLSAEEVLALHADFVLEEEAAVSAEEVLALHADLDFLELVVATVELLYGAAVTTGALVTAADEA